MSAYTFPVDDNRTITVESGPTIAGAMNPPRLVSIAIDAKWGPNARSRVAVMLNRRQVRELIGAIEAVIA